jgi:dienelactone hydrolase
MFYPLFINVLGKGTQKKRDYWALFADNFLILQTITNLINRKIDFLSTNYKQKDRMKRIITYSIIALLQASVALAQTSSKPKLQKREKYEWQGEIPTYVETLKKELTYPMAWGNSPIRNFKKWKKAARAKVFECMMTPPKAAAAWDMEVLGEEQRDGYKAQKIAFNINAYSRITAYLLIPDGKGPFPTVNALHDHGAHLFIGKEKMIRPFFTPEEQDAPAKQALCQEILDDADAWARQLYDNQYVGDYLVKHGYVVFSADAPMWGERGRKEGVDRNKYDLIAGNMMMLGRDLSAFMTYDDISSTEFLASLPMVDAKRIGCVGCSMGAYRSWMLSALSDRIKAGASICWMITTDAQLTRRFGRKENGGFANCIPGLRQYLDYPHIASLACPKPMLFINGTKDKLFPVPGVKDAFAEMHKVWKSQGADNLLDTELWEIPHSCGLKAQEKMLEFLDKNLK